MALNTSPLVHTFPISFSKFVLSSSLSSALGILSTFYGFPVILVF
jgi:hypothetical protein